MSGYGVAKRDTPHHAGWVGVGVGESQYGSGPAGERRMNPVAVERSVRKIFLSKMSSIFPCLPIMA